MRKSCYYLCLCTLLLLALPLSHVQAADQKKDTAPLVCPPSKVENIVNGTHDALACEWVDAKAVGLVLNALQLLTSSPPNPAQAVNELIKGDPKDKDLYIAALGEPDAPDQPTGPALSKFLDTLAKANRLNKNKTEPEGQLFTETESFIQEIFNTGPGKLALVKINDSFNGKANYVALFQLLNAYPPNKEDGSVNADYAANLEKLRAAFEMNTNRLALQVAAKIAPAKE